MHPVISHVNWLAREVQKELKGSDMTAESIRAAINELCPHDGARIRDRIFDQVQRNLRQDGQADTTNSDHVPSPKSRTSKRSSSAHVGHGRAVK